MTDELFLMTGLNGEIGQSLSCEFNKKNQKFLRLEDYLSGKHVNSQPKRLIHLAGYADESNSEKIIDANIVYLQKVLDKLADSSVEEIIFFSSVTVYGKQNKEDVNEGDTFISPGLYGCSKLLGERLLGNSRFKSLCLRLPGVLEIKKSTTFLSKTFEKMRTGSDIYIYNGEKIYNNFISVPTLAEFLINLKPYMQHDAINLGSNKELTLIEIMNLLKSNLNSSSNIFEHDSGSEFFNLSINKAVENYNFVPGVVKDTLVNWSKSRSLTQENLCV